MRSSRFFDLLRILQAAGPARVLNYCALLISYSFSLLIRKPLRTGLPAFITVEPTDHCNLHCPECPEGAGILTRPSGYMDKKKYLHILNEISKHTIYLTLYFQGEPYLHPNFMQMIAEAKQKGMYIATSTNAHFLDMDSAEQTIRSGLDRIIISFDGPDLNAYESYRKNGNWESVLQGVRNLVEAKKRLASRTPYIILQCLIIKHNEHRLYEVRSLYHKLNADRLEFKTLQLLDVNKPSALLPDNPRFSRYRQNNHGGYELKKRMKNHCFRAWSSCVITWDGIVVPCCYDKNAAHELGRITEDSFSEIWNGQVAKAFIKNVFRARKKIDICRNCGE